MSNPTGAHCSETSNSNADLLLSAAKSGNLTQLQALLNCNITDADINTVDGDDRTPLSLASHHGHLEVVALLLSHPQIDVNAADKVFGNTALIVASRRGHADVVDLLLNHSEIDPNRQSKHGNTALSQASILVFY